MPRAVTVCSLCGDVIWFGDNDPVPQAVRCACSETILTESGPDGAWQEPTAEDLSKVTS